MVKRKITIELDETTDVACLESIHEWFISGDECVPPYFREYGWGCTQLGKILEKVKEVKEE